MRKRILVDEELRPELRELLDTPPPKTATGDTREAIDVGYNPDADPEFTADYLKMQFVAELREAMADAGMSNSELARRTKKSRQAVSKALDTTDPDNFTIERMAELVCAVGARISIKVHEPDTKVVAVSMNANSLQQLVAVPRVNHTGSIKN